MATEDGATEDTGKPETRLPLRVRLPGFIKDDDEVGLGDVIRRASYLVGLPSCGGCDQRATAMNRWMVFSR
jgi:hypothetical protein